MLLSPYRLISATAFHFSLDNGNLHGIEIGSIVTHYNNYTLNYLPHESGATLWPRRFIKCLLVTSFITKFVIDNLVPYDGRPTIVIDTVALLLVMVILLLAVIGTVFAVICLAFNLAYRNTRLYQTPLLLLLLSEFI